LNNVFLVPAVLDKGPLNMLVSPFLTMSSYSTTQQIKLASCLLYCACYIKTRTVCVGRCPANPFVLGATRNL